MAAQNLTRYHTAPPSRAVIMYDRKSLNELAAQYPCGLLHDENGGYYLKDAHAKVVGVAADGLCTELDAAYAEAAAVWPKRNAKSDGKVGGGCGCAGPGPGAGAGAGGANKR
ncbi:hypothetical protein BJY01DRAFT_221290 [Aspergillus pseudoustus]|uniref:Uncharacterized protein n=1 Tax=Aspergillus pseudoustus TaxID=1810923 RepID=A0ABR4JAQ9_9EURO